MSAHRHKFNTILDFLPYFKFLNYITSNTKTTLLLNSVTHDAFKFNVASMYLIKTLPNLFDLLG